MLGLDDDSFCADTAGAVVKHSVHRKVPPAVCRSRMRQPLDVVMLWEGAEQVEQKSFKSIGIQAAPTQRHGD